MSYCSCVFDSPRRNVLVDLSEGRVLAVYCAECKQRMLFGDLEDDFVNVHATELPLVMTAGGGQEYEYRGGGVYEPIEVWHYELAVGEVAG